MYTAFRILFVHTLCVRENRIKWTDGPTFVLSSTGKPIVAEGFIYVIPAQAMVKIGMTRWSMYRRWHSLRTGNPWLEVPLYVSPPLMDRVAAVEKECHAALAVYRKSGEWFECDRDLAVMTVRRICGE